MQAPTPTQRVALVTGAASGIGRAIAERLIADGLAVVSADLTPDPDGPGEPLEVDLATHEGNAAAIDFALERHGRLDAVIASAGFQHLAAIEEFPVDRWEDLLAVLLTSPFLLARHAWPALAESGDGRFVVIASVHALVAAPYKAGYVAAKHGVLGLVRTLALEGAPRGIYAMAVCPGYVRTPLVESQIEARARLYDMSPERVLDEVVLAPHAVKRLIEPEQVADVVAMLLGPTGAAFTGTPVTFDQGWTAS